MIAFSSSSARRLSAAASLLAVIAVTGCNRDPNVRKQKYLESGQRYEKEGKYREATLQFYNALKADKNFAPAHYELAKSLLKLGMPMQAYPELQMAVNQAPNNLQARVDLGNLLLAGRQTDRAEEQAKLVLKQQPNNADGLALLAAVAAARGQRDEAIDTLSKAIAADPSRADLHTNLAILKGAGGRDLNSAREELDKAISLDNKNVQAHLAMSSLMSAQNNLPGAEDELKKASAADPTNLQARTALAALYLRENKMPEAETVIKQTSDDFAENTEGAGMLERFYERTGQFPKAEPAYAALASKHPKSFPIQIAYARILAAGGNFAKSNEVLSKEADSHANDPQFIQLKTGLLQHDGKTDEAFTTVQNGSHNNPDNAQLKQLLGFMARDKGDLNLAASSFRSALQLAPGDLNAAGGLAEVSNRLNDNTGLRQVADTMIKMYPKSALPYLWRATADANEGRTDSAVENLQTSIKLDPKNPQALTELGQVRLKQGKTAEGKGLLEQALALDPNSKALPLLVQLDMQAGQSAAAVALIQQQISHNPNNPGLLMQLAGVQLATKDPHGALDNASKALKLNPGNPVAMQVYTQASLATNDLAGPTEMWQKWADAHPRDAQAQSFLGMLSESAGDNGKAIAYYQKSLQLQPEQPAVQNNLAYLMADSGQNTDVALTLAQSAQRSSPHSPDIADTLAWVYYKKGVYGSALDLLQNAAKDAPNNATIQYHMGLVYGKMNNKTAASASLKRAVSLSGGSDIGKKAQAELDKLG